MGRSASAAKVAEPVPIGPVCQGCRKPAPPGTRLRLCWRYVKAKQRDLLRLCVECRGVGRQAPRLADLEGG